jgi:hypothetical protein
MLGYIAAGSILFISSATAYKASLSTKKDVESSKENSENSHIRNAPICKVPYSVVNISYDNLNNPNDPQYINITLKNGNGEQYNL